MELNALLYDSIAKTWARTAGYSGVRFLQLDNNYGRIYFLKEGAASKTGINRFIGIDAKGNITHSRYWPLSTCLKMMAEYSKLLLSHDGSDLS